MDAFQEAHLQRWLATLMAFVLAFAVLTLVGRVVWGRLAKWAAATPATWDDLLLRAARTPLVALNLVASLTLAVQVAPEAARAHPLSAHLPKILLTLGVLWLIERLASVTFEVKPLAAKITESDRRLGLTLLRLFVVGTGALVVMDTLGVNITPILASLGVGSVAVALALQDTLSNFFSGIYLLVDRPVRIGDNVKLEDGTEGSVAMIGWRSTHIRLGTNATLIMPNAKLASSRLVNFDLPTGEFVLILPMAVTHTADLSHVESISLDVARALQTTHPGAVPGFEPLVRFGAFVESTITFSVIMRAKAYDAHGLLKHDAIKALQQRFREEKVDAPYPQRVVRTVSAVTTPS